MEEILDSTGFVLIDSLYRPVYANPESIKILGFPNEVSNPESLDGILAQKISSFLPHNIDLFNGTSLIQFQSGRRHYICRAFILRDHWAAGSDEARIALIFERGLSGPPSSIKTQRKLSGMNEDPFSFAPDPGYYYFSRAHQEIFATMRRMVREKLGIGVLLAQSGMGKTALLGSLTEVLRPESEIAVLPGSFDTRSELVRAVMASFGVDGMGRELSTNLQQFQHWLISKHKSGKLVTLICDDAQDLSVETLENLCLFSEMESESKKLIQVVLAGRQGLLEKLTSFRLDKVVKRIAVYCRLMPMDEAEVRSYILHRLRIAGATRQLFTSAALSSIALYSRGIPMNINMICRHSLSLAATINLSIIDERIIADSAYDLVLRAQPANIWEEPFSIPQESNRSAGLLRDRRGLRLVPKI
jgi:general secretion pathway protein A